ncbi:MAG: lysophospholipid acyltransferase family protein [Burkholderiaceae bacterium]|nr:lysophospholipid acyltransferase family protein [Burkholderiaceae bacterium]
MTRLIGILITAFVRMLAHVPLRWLHAVGAPMGWVAYAASASYRARYRANSQRAGVPWALAQGGIAAAGRLMMELPPLWLRAPDVPLPVTVQWQGGELIEAAQAAGRGLVMLTPHLGCFEVIGQSYAQRYGAGRGAMTVLYRPARKPWLRDLVEAARRRPGLDAAPATLSGVRQMIRALKRGEVVGLLPDQVPPEGLGVWAPFFGQPAYTMTLAARLVQQTGAALLLVWSERLPRGAGYCVRVSELGEPLPQASVAAATVINRAMESLILQCPQQYLWGYHRFKHPRSGAAASSGATASAPPSVGREAS